MIEGCIDTWNDGGADGIVEGNKLDCLAGMIEGCIDGTNNVLTLGIVDGATDCE